MDIKIDSNSGYCFGVEYAIQMAEDEMESGNGLYCLGDIVHNNMEIERLQAKGLKIVSKQDLENLNNCKVLIRAHGEPPETYQLALKNNITLIDASCPVVLKLQNRVKHSYDKIKETHGQVVVYGQKGHAEVIGISGQTNDNAIIVTTEEDLDALDFTKPISFYSQTTKSTAGFYKMKALIEERIAKTGQNPHDDSVFDANDSICRQVSNREPQLKVFSAENDVIIFVSGKKSSNGKALYQVCKASNSQSYFIENAEELEGNWFANADKVGICGATSTPMWLMQEVADRIAAISKF
ncbi:MAG: 4-hydroxy-3-methylbut-2-enyl diphosphate reductase [Opitutaceae bacterium]|nr:4-hydroxy-3-methylbut-2-enyl diphosphate reductase [Cytophagales bacterium]